MMNRRPNVVIAISIVLAAVLTAVAGWVMAQMREDALASARAAAFNMTLLFERDTQRNFDVYALSLQGVIDAIDDPRLAELPDNLRQSVLFDRSATAKSLGEILVANANGDVIFDSRVSPPRKLNVAGRDYFVAQRDSPHTGLYVSHPMMARDGPDDATIGLSRRLEKPDGSFAGVVVGTMRLDYFRRLMSGIEIGAHGAVTLTLADGTLLMRRPYAPEMIGLNLADSALFQRFGRAREGGFFGIGPVDGVRRWFAFRRVEGYPLVFSVAVAAGDIYTKWRARAWIIGSLTALLDALLIAFAVLLSRQLRRRELLEDELRALAGTDALTALANRRAFEARADHEWLRARRAGQPLAVMMLDVDRFKPFNDRYGHTAGDAALASVARSIGSHARRPADCAARYGGEEFVLLLPDTNAAQALAHAEKLRSAIETLDIPHADSPNNVLTASVGVASTSARDFESWRALVEAADAALYKAKRGGRNRVAVWQPSFARAHQGAGPEL